MILLLQPNGVSVELTRRGPPTSEELVDWTGAELDGLEYLSILFNGKPAELWCDGTDRHKPAPVKHSNGVAVALYIASMMARGVRHFTKAEVRVTGDAVLLTENNRAGALP